LPGHRVAGRGGVLRAGPRHGSYRDAPLSETRGSNAAV